MDGPVRRVRRGGGGSHVGGRAGAWGVRGSGVRGRGVAGLQVGPVLAVVQRVGVLAGQRTAGGGRRGHLPRVAATVGPRPHVVLAAGAHRRLHRHGRRRCGALHGWRRRRLVARPLRGAAEVALRVLRLGEGVEVTRFAAEPARGRGVVGGC